MARQMNIIMEAGIMLFAVAFVTIWAVILTCYLLCYLAAWVNK